DGGQFFGGLAGITNGIESVDPFNVAIDKLGGALGLPPAIRNIAKVVIGLNTGNFLLAANGAAGLMAEANKNEPAKTEMAPPSDPAVASAGYCSTAAPPAPTYGAAQAMDMNSAEFMNWVPSDPYLRQMRQEAIDAKHCGDPAHADFCMRNYERFAREYLENNYHGTRDEFEQHFNCKLDSCGGGGASELIIRPLVSGAAQPGVSFGPGSYTSGTGETGSAPPSYSAGSSSGSPDSSISTLYDKLASAHGATDEAAKHLDSPEGQLKYQEAKQREQELFTLLSNIIQMNHQMAMTAIQNMKG
ncbi:MAG: hypothetical protein ACJ790_02445, partial [Myxococcaceae bacterium]